MFHVLQGLYSEKLNKGPGGEAAWESRGGGLESRHEPKEKLIRGRSNVRGAQGKTDGGGGKHVYVCRIIPVGGIIPEGNKNE